MLQSTVLTFIHSNLASAKNFLVDIQWKSPEWHLPAEKSVPSQDSLTVFDQQSSGRVCLAIGTIRLQSLSFAPGDTPRSIRKKD
jgi:hypothetical protein